MLWPYPAPLPTHGRRSWASCLVTGFVVAFERRITHEFKTRPHWQPDGCRIHRGGVLDYDFARRTLWCRAGAKRPACPTGRFGHGNQCRKHETGVLVESNGLTVYLFLADSSATSACNSASCVQYWPPVLTKGAPQAGPGVNASLLGTITRADGTAQVTYAGHPLYRFVSDKAAGDSTGQGVNAFGALWYVLSPSGAQIA